MHIVIIAPYCSGIDSAHRNSIDTEKQRRRSLQPSRWRRNVMGVRQTNSSSKKAHGCWCSLLVVLSIVSVWTAPVSTTLPSSVPFPRFRSSRSRASGSRQMDVVPVTVPETEATVVEAEEVETPPSNKERNIEYPAACPCKPTGAGYTFLSTQMQRNDFEIMAPLAATIRCRLPLPPVPMPFISCVQGLNMRSRSSANFTLDDLRNIASIAAGRE